MASTPTVNSDSYFLHYTCMKLHTLIPCLPYLYSHNDSNMHNFPSTSNDPSTSYQSNAWSKSQPWSTQVPMRYSNPRCLACAAHQYPGAHCVTQSHQNLFRDRESLNTENASIQVNTPGTPDHERLGFIAPNDGANNLTMANHFLGTPDHERLDYVDPEVPVTNSDIVNHIDITGLSIQDAPNNQSIPDQINTLGTLDHGMLDLLEPNEPTNNQDTSIQGVVSNNPPTQELVKVTKSKSNKDHPITHGNETTKDDQGTSNDISIDKNPKSEVREDQSETQIQCNQEADNSDQNTQQNSDPSETPAGTRDKEESSTVSVTKDSNEDDYCSDEIPESQNSIDTSNTDTPDPACIATMRNNLEK